MIEEIEQYDNSFNEEEFLSKVNHIFIMVLNAIMDRDMSSVKHYLSNDVYEKYNNKVQSYLNEKKIRLYDEMNVKTSSITNYTVTKDDIQVEVLLTSRYMDYFVNEDGEYLYGTNDHRLEKNYRIVLTKKRETKDLGEARRCPSCGNTLDINNTGKCPYCNNIIDMSNYDYIVTLLEVAE